MGYAQVVCGIYCIENIDTHKKYIGQSKNIYKRWVDHKWALNNNIHDNDYLQKAWNKYGSEHFVFNIIEVCPVNKLDEREMYYINYFATHDRANGYNLRGGGGRIGDMTPEVREKFRGENNPMYGKHHSEETRKKLSDARKDMYTNENHPRCKAVYCIELNMVFWGAKEAEVTLGINRNNICNCCSGRIQSAGKHPVTKEKLHWLYLNDALELGHNIDCNNKFALEVTVYGDSI